MNSVIPEQTKLSNLPMLREVGFLRSAAAIEHSLAVVMELQENQISVLRAADSRIILIPLGEWMSTEDLSVRIHDEIEAMSRAGGAIDSTTLRDYVRALSSAAALQNQFLNYVSQKVLEYDARLNRDEVAPTGDDYQSIYDIMTKYHMWVSHRD
jgi:hypothetical protein